MNLLPHVKSDDGPVLLLAGAFVFEILRAWRLRGRSDRPFGWTAATWFIRPWAIWAAFNLVFRAFWHNGFNNRRTFPFFANKWMEIESWPEFAARLFSAPDFLLWIAIAAASGVAAVRLLRASAGTRGENRPGLMLASLTLLSALLPAVFAFVPGGARNISGNVRGPLAPWFETGGTMLHAMPFVKSTDHFLRNFEAIQPRLEISIHGLSHPPLATLSLAWLGHVSGAEGTRQSVEADRLRYAIPLTLAAALAVPAMYLLGFWMFGSVRAGLLAAALWAVKPAALAHNTFAQDGVYTIFFILGLALGWRLVTRPDRSAPTAAALGAVFFALTQLTFSWCILTAIFALHAAWTGWSSRWTSRDWWVRLFAPLGVMTILLAGFCFRYRMNYFSVYLTASHFVDGFYDYANTYQWIMALVGGQMALLLQMGALVASWFCVRTLPGWWRDRLDPAVRFGLLVLGVYLIPVLIGPDCLKMETERCWSWVTAVPLAFVARELAARADGARWAGTLATLNLGQYFVFRLFACVLS